MTILPKNGSDWSRTVVLLVALGVAWGTLKADVSSQQRQIDALAATKADATESHAEYQSIMAAIQDVQNRLTREHR